MKAVEKQVGQLQKGLEVAQSGLADMQRALAQTQTGLAEMHRSVGHVHQVMIATNERIDTGERRFDNFVCRFDEVTEMLVTHDTDQLQRVTAVELEQARLQQEMDEARARIESLEKKAG